MDLRNRTAICLLIALLATMTAAGVFAQDRIDVPEPEDPAVEALLETKPSTPVEMVRAANILARLQRPELGRQFLARVLAANLNQQQLSELAETFGSAMFIEMANQPGLLPEAHQLANQVMEAADRQLQDPKRLAHLIGQLQDPSIEVRTMAVEGLREARGAGVGAMIMALADPGRADEHPNIRAAIVRLGREAVDPLIGTLERSDPRLMVQAAALLGAIGDRKAIVYLLGPYASEKSDPKLRAAAREALVRMVGRAPTDREALAILMRNAQTYFNREQPIAGVFEGNAELWRWDAAKKQPVAETVPEDDARRALAARFARDALALAGDDPAVRRLYLATMLEEAAYRNGLDKPLDEGEGSVAAEAASFGPAVLEQAMQYALENDHVGAAAAAARILGRISTAQRLVHDGAEPTPLVRMARHPDRRVRLAALEAIVRLQPTHPFPGSSYVPQSLAFFAATSGSPRALLAGPNTQTIQRLAGYLSAFGIEADTVATGRELIRKATSSPDYEILLIDAAIGHPTLEILLQQLRHDYRTATVRVGIIARDGYLRQAERAAKDDPLAMAFSRPHTQEDFNWQMEQLTTLAPRQFVAHDERQQQAASALARLAELSESSADLYDVRATEQLVARSLYVPELSTHTIDVLGNLTSAASQRALVEMASRTTQPIEVRQAAVKAFRKNVGQNGLLLTTAEIDQQYERYNQSESLDAATQQILGLILDSIEAPTTLVEAAAAPQEKAIPDNPAAEED